MNICPFMSGYAPYMFDAAASPAGDYFEQGTTVFPKSGTEDPQINTETSTNVSNKGVMVSQIYNDMEEPTGFGFIYHNCLGEKCQMYDTTNNRCSMQVSDTIRNPENETNSLIVMLEKVLGKVSEKDAGNSLLGYLQDILGKNGEKDTEQSLVVFLQNVLGNNNEKKAAEGQGSSLIKVANHIHGAHWHPEQHKCSEIPVGCGSYTFGAGAPYAAKLVNEYMSYEDLDGNGFIYGKDFKVKNGDDKPPMLLAVEENPMWAEPKTQVSWASIKAWSDDPDNNPDPLQEDS